MNRSVLLLGPRQTGKSTLVRAELPAGALVVDLLHTEEYLRYVRDPSIFRREVEHHLSRGGPPTVFVDEVQRIPALLDEVHSLIETTGVRFVLTGSSARKLKRGAANLLAGRVSVRHLHPLTLEELGDAAELETLLRFGALPPVSQVARDEPEIASEILRAYALTYLQEEVQAEAIVRQLGAFARFLDVAAAQSGELVNYSSVGRDAGLATRTVQAYYEILEDTLLGFRLPAWQRSPRARLVAHPRFHLFDLGVTNALCRRLGAPPDPVRRGHLFEQMVVLECHRRIEYGFPEARLFFWRTNHGAEVDLLIEHHGELCAAVEIKARGVIDGADLSGLRSFAEAHPAVRRYCVSTAPRGYRVGEVEVLPFAEFFARFDEILRG